MSGIWGADVTELRALATSLQSASDSLGSTTSQLSSLVESASQWKGADADQFRSEWTGTTASLLRAASQTLADAGQAVLRNADEQHSASTDGESIPSPGVPSPGGPAGPGGPGVPTGPGGGPLGGKSPDGGWPGLDDLWDGGMNLWNAFSTGKGLLGLPSSLSLAGSFLEASRLADLGSDAAAAATSFSRGMAASDMFILGSSTVGRFGVGALGLVGAVSSFQTMLHSDYDGVRGGFDQVMGGVGVVGGIGTTLVAVGLVSNPVGIAVVGTAAVAAGLWTAGNYVVDNWDSISGGISDGYHAVTNFGSDVAHDIGDGLSKAGDFLGGLF